MSNRRVKRIAGCLLAVLLFSQGAFAAVGCDRLQRAPAEAIAMASQDAPPCHPEPGPAKSVCVAHCLADFQTLDKPAFPVPALFAAPVIVLVRVDSLVKIESLRLDAARPVVHPPPRILFQSFLI